MAYDAAASLSRKVRRAADVAGASLDPIFMNAADIDQPAIASYGEGNVRCLKAAQKQSDTNLVFQKLVTRGQKMQ